MDVHFASVTIDTDYRLHAKVVSATGGHLNVKDYETLQAELKQWRERRPAVEGPSSPSSIRFDVDFDVVEAAFRGDLKARAGAVRVQRESGETEVSVGACELESGAITLHAADAQVKLAGSSLEFREAHAASAEVAWTMPTRSDVLVPSSPDGPPVVPDLPDVPVSPKLHKRGVSATTEPPAPVPPLLPDLHALRTTISALTASAASRLPDGSRVRVDSLSVRVKKGDEQLTLGSGTFDVGRDPQRIELSFSTSPLARATPLSLRVDLPTGPGDVEISASGGPVPLGLLGMHDGGLLHLLDVDRASFSGRGRVVLDAPGQSLSFDVEGSVRDLSMNDARLAREPVRRLDLGISAKGLIDDKGALRLDDAEAAVGAARASLHGGFVQSADHISAAFDFDFPTASCQALLTSIPSALVPTVSSARMDGTFSLRGRLAVDTRNLDDIGFDFDVKDHCRLVDVPAALDKSRFASSFTHVVYSKTGDVSEETTGPGTPNWTDLDDISPYMQVAVLTTEDGAFFHHHGFNHSAIRHAVAANIRARRFVRGASTITMQLAKNLFLSREKTLSRKLEELILADYLEQAFTKEEMMELYLNIIEFGPDLYGVAAAAQHYFARRPNELNLAECMFMSSILPNPIAFHKVYGDGQLGEGWMRTVRARMQVAAQVGLISPAELAEGLTEVVVFHRESSPAPPPRPPVSTPTHPAANSSDWQELN